MELNNVTSDEVKWYTIKWTEMNKLKGKEMEKPITYHPMK